MPEAWRYPVAEPLFTDALAAEMVETGSPHAFPTRLRFSDAGKCARAIAYEVIGAERGPVDPAALHVMAIGTLYHEAWQQALMRRFPGTQVEVKGIVAECTDSGHADAVVPEAAISAVVTGWQGGNVAFELKTRGTYQFDQATGNYRKAWKPRDPRGPSLPTILQGGLNALANGCETVVIGYVCFENYSLGFASRAGMRHMDRFLAEWHIGKDVWMPLVEAEIDRLGAMLATVDAGNLPSREVYDDDWALIELDPEAKNPPWFCTYCSFRDVCVADGPGYVKIAPGRVQGASDTPPAPPRPGPPDRGHAPEPDFAAAEAERVADAAAGYPVSQTLKGAS